MNRIAIHSAVACALSMLTAFDHCLAESYSTGSGCFISSNEVLTAHHVVADGSEISVALEDGDWMKATVIRSDKGLDWAVLKVRGTSPAMVSVSNRPLDLGDKVYTLGYPSASILGLGLKYADGVVSSLSGLAGDVNRFQMTIPIQPGNSGGPVFDEHGGLVGIVSSTVDPDKFYSITSGALPQNLNFAVPIGKVPLAFKQGNGCELKSNKKATCFVRCKIGTGRQTVSAPSKSVRPKNAAKGKIAQKDERGIDENVGVVDIGKLFSFELGRAYPEMLRHKAVERDNTIGCLYSYKRPFLNFVNGYAELSKKSSTLIELYAYTDEYDVPGTGKAWKDAERAVALIEEKFGIKMEKTFCPMRDIGVTDSTPLRRRNEVVGIAEEWKYTSWPNFYNQGSDYKSDPHHTLTVTLYDHFYEGFSRRLIWIGLVGTVETRFAAEEIGAKARDAKRHQEALDAL